MLTEAMAYPLRRNREHIFPSHLTIAAKPSGGIERNCSAYRPGVGSHHRSEYPVKMALVRESAVVGNLGRRQHFEEPLRREDPLLELVSVRRKAEPVSKGSQEVKPADSGCCGQFNQGNIFKQVVV